MTTIILAWLFIGFYLTLLRILIEGLKQGETFLLTFVCGVLIGLLFCPLGPLNYFVFKFDKL